MYRETDRERKRESTQLLCDFSPLYGKLWGFCFLCLEMPRLVNGVRQLTLAKYRSSGFAISCIFSGVLFSFVPYIPYINEQSDHICL